HGDIAWGGNWFFITEDTPLPLTSANREALCAFTTALRRALSQQGIRGAEGAEIDHVELSAVSPTDGIDSRTFVLCPGLVWDRSPCGTGTSAKLACLMADGKLDAGTVWKQEGILGSVFEGSCRPTRRGVLPIVTGNAHVTARSTLIVQDEDPFAWGIPA